MLMRAIHQVAIDHGSWNTATALLPIADPLSRAEFGGTRKDLAAVYAYQESLAKLRSHNRSDKQPPPPQREVNLDQQNDELPQQDAKGKGRGKNKKGKAEGGENAGLIDQ